MKKILSSYRYEPIPKSQQDEIKFLFNQISQETIEKIYQLASEKMNVLKRFALMQSRANNSR